MTTNTQGPWRTDATGGFPLDIHDQDNVLVARVQPCRAAHNVARRIVACVNACEGVSTALLEQDRLQGYEPRGHVKHLQDQRDQLLAALESIANSSEQSTALGLQQLARAAIAAAKGGAA